MAFEGIDYLTIDGRRYHFSDFKRFGIPVEGPEIAGKRVQPPYIDYQQKSFGGGITDDDGDTSGQFYRSAVGMEPVGPGGASTGNWLRVGKMGTTFATAGAALNGRGLSQLLRIVALSSPAILQQQSGPRPAMCGLPKTHLPLAIPRNSCNSISASSHSIAIMPT